MTTDARARYLDVLLKRLEAHEGPVADAERYMERLDVLAGVDVAQKQLTAGTPPIEGSTPAIEHGSDHDGTPVREALEAAPRPEGAQQAPVSASDGAGTTSPPQTPAAPSPEAVPAEPYTQKVHRRVVITERTPSGNPAGKQRAGRRGKYCIAGCGTEVSGDGKRCRQCSGAETLHALQELAERAVAQVAKETPPPAITVKFCARCNGRMIYERTATGDEWSCMQCGNVSYGEKFSTVTDEAPNARGASHAGSRL